MLFLKKITKKSTQQLSVNLFFLQFGTFIQGLFAGQLLVGGIFTNFMLITVLGFIALKLFISFTFYVWQSKLIK